MVREVETGFKDPNDVYPKKSSMFKQDSDLPPTSVQRNALSGTWIEQRLARQDISVPLTYAGVEGYSYWSEPMPDYNAEYPYNKTYQSESGHVKEVDDTPGHERLNWQHRVGTYEEVDSNGNVVRKIIGSNYEIVCSDEFVYIKGRTSLTVEGSHHMLVLGDTYTEVRGNETKLVHGDSHTKIAGDQTIEVGGDRYCGVEGDNQIRVAGNQAIESKGWNYTWAEGDLAVTAKKSAVFGGMEELQFGSNGDAYLQATGTVFMDATQIQENSGTPSPQFSDNTSSGDPFGAETPDKNTLLPKTVINTWKEGLKQFVERILS